MKITKKQLESLVKEAVQKSLNEAYSPDKAIGDFDKLESFLSTLGVKINQDDINMYLQGAGPMPTMGSLDDKLVRSLKKIEENKRKLDKAEKMVSKLRKKVLMLAIAEEHGVKK